MTHEEAREKGITFHTEAKRSSYTEAKRSSYTEAKRSSYTEAKRSSYTEGKHSLQNEGKRSFYKETKHSMLRRAPWHDYRRPGLYMLTMVTRGRRAVFGSLMAEPEPHIELSALGKTVLFDEMPKIHRYYPNVEVWKMCVMPDHLHIIVRVKADFEAGKHLGKVVKGFKSGCNNAYWNIIGNRGKGLFETNYNDKILLDGEVLQRWKNYLDDNPRRLLMKRQNPGFFTILHNLVIGEWECQIVGNRFLLDVPDKMAVIVHRGYGDEEYNRLCEEWLECGERGGVLVSAAVAPREKAVMREAMNRGYRIVLLRENGFPELYKPAGEAFDACAEGRLLMVSPWEYHFEKRVISREQCLKLNRLAETIVETSHKGAGNGDDYGDGNRT